MKKRDSPKRPNSAKVWVLVFILQLASLPGGGLLAQTGAEVRWGTREELRELRKREVPGLLKALADNERLFIETTHPRAQAPSKKVSSWKIAIEQLRRSIDDARPELIELLDGQDRSLCGRAINVLTWDEIKHRQRLRKKMIQLLNDDSVSVRKSAVTFLWRIKDEEIESIFAKRMKSLALAEKKDLDLVIHYLHAIADMPIKEDRVVDILLYLMDNVNQEALLFKCVEKSKQFRSSERHGPELAKGYWRMLNDTKRGDLRSLAARALDGQTRGALALLLQAPTIHNKTSRAAAAGALVDHPGFDPVKREALFSSLLDDRSPLVRREVVTHLTNRHDVSAALRVRTILEVLSDQDQAKSWRFLYGDLFTVLQNLPAEKQLELLREKKIGLGRKIAGDLGDETFRRFIIFHSSKVMGKAYREGNPSQEELDERVVAWWQQFDA